MENCRYLASGDSMTSMSYQYLVGKTTASTIIHETCEAIWNHLCPLVLSSRLTERDWLNIAHNFEEKWNFVHCIGAIDGKHVNIQVCKFTIHSIIKKEVQFQIIILCFSVLIMLDQCLLIINTITA